MSEEIIGRDRRGFVAKASAAAVLAALNRRGFAQVHARSQTSKSAAGETDVSGSASLKEHAARAGLLFGFAVNAAAVRSDAAYRSLVIQQCSIMVAENAMKWKALRPAANQFQFDEADALVAFAQDNHIKLRGHNLCWHEALPAWFAGTATAANARDLLLNHIRTVAGRYAGRIHSWDVVNEAIDPKAGQPDGMRNSPWLQLVGPDYVDAAFRAARIADPKALLTYNEYGFEEESADSAAKRAATLELLRGMKQRKVPIDAVGVQSHLTAGRTYGPGLTQFIEACRSLDLQVFLTELDVNDRHLPADVPARDAAVAEVYRDYLGATLRGRNVAAVLTWGVDDANTWLNGIKSKREDGLPERPLLFDGAMQPAPAFFAARGAFAARKSA